MSIRQSVFKVLNRSRPVYELCRVRSFSTETKRQENTSETRKLTHFGFEVVDEEEKRKKVHNMFETVAETYDMIIDVLSFGIHRVWRDTLLQRLDPTHGTKLLDMAGGTGDITFRYINYLKNRGPPPEGKRSSVTVCDINQAMLNVGKGRAQRQGYTSSECGVDIEWICGDAERLALPDDVYSAYTIGFGVRNCTRIDKVLEEAYRVLAPGGRFLCLEFSHIHNEALQWAYDRYSFQMIPILGQLITGHRQPFHYLIESIRQFPDQEKFKGMIEDAGFRQVSYENLTFGMCAIHSGFKL